MANTFRVEIGLDYLSSTTGVETRAEIGDVISDLPANAITELLAIQAISKAKAGK